MQARRPPQVSSPVSDQPGGADQSSPCHRPLRPWLSAPIITTHLAPISRRQHLHHQLLPAFWLGTIQQRTPSLQAGQTQASLTHQHLPPLPQLPPASLPASLPGPSQASQGVAASRPAAVTTRPAHVMWCPNQWGVYSTRPACVGLCDPEGKRALPFITQTLSSVYCWSYLSL